MSEATGGLKTALDALAPTASGPVAEPEQLDLLGLPVTPAAQALAEKRGPGRPPGARNKRTEAWAEYLLARYGSPLEVLMQIANMPIVELVAGLGCSALEALQEKRHAAIALAPYIHQRQAVAVDLTGAPAINLTINRNSTQVVSSGVGSLAGRIVEVLDNQELSEDGS